jgi:hypothetical protein
MQFGWNTALARAGHGAAADSILQHSATAVD